MSSLLVFFFSKIDQDIYYVEQNFRGTRYLADFEDFLKIYDINAKKKLRKLTSLNHVTTLLKNLCTPRHSSLAFDFPAKVNPNSSPLTGC